MRLVEKIGAYLKKSNDTFDIEAFQKNAEEFVLNYMMNTEYKTYDNLLKEIIFLIHYTFQVLKDDCLIGKKILKGDITRIDNYVFSKYRREDILKENIEQLVIVACSNRFEEDPHENLFAYYVFLEEVGIEIIDLFNDFYEIIDSGNKTEKSKNFSYVGKTEIPNVNEIKNGKKLDAETLMTEMLSEYHSPMEVQKKILKNESLFKENFDIAKEKYKNIKPTKGLDED